MKSSYHHGDLRAALLTEARHRVECGESFSLRELSRKAGVNPRAVYRHFTDRQALETTLADEGLTELLTAITADGVPTTPEQVAEAAQRYVRFALDHPGLFRLMFGRERDVDNPDRVAAAARILQLLEFSMGTVYPERDATPLAHAVWALVHGLALLHLDGKLPQDCDDVVDARVRAACRALLPDVQ